MWSLARFRSSTARRRLWTLLVVTVLLLSVVPAAQLEPAGAQDGTPEAAEQPPAVHTYTARKAVCPSGTILAESSRETLFSACTEPLENVSFTLEGESALYPGDTRATQIQPGGPAAFTNWSEIPVGMPYSVTETIPNGYGEPWVYCEYFLGAPGNAADSTSYGAAPGGRVGYLIGDPPYQNVLCTWFNVPLAADAQATPGAIGLSPPDGIGGGVLEQVGTGRVIVVKHYCPTGFEITLGSYHGYNGDCDILGPEVSYTLEYGAGLVSAKPAPQLGAGFSQNAQWEDIPVGTIRITEAPIEGFATLGVYCTTGPVDTTLPNAPADNWSPENGWVEYVLQEDYAVRCDWFNVRLPGLQDIGTVSVYKEYCRPGYVPPAVGEAYNQNCGVNGPEASFQLSSGGQPGAPPDEQDDRNFAWYGVPAGALSIVEEPPSMHETAAVFCDSFAGVDPNDPSSAAAPPPNRVEHQGNTLNWDLMDGNYLRCIWQNAPIEGAYGNLLISKRRCPEGYTFGSKPLEDLLDGCAEPHAGIQFSLEFETGETAQGTTALEGDEAVASFLEQPPGNVRVSEAPPEGYALARVYCTRYELTDDPVLPDSSNSDQEPVTNNGFVYSISAGFEAACYLFDIPRAGTGPPEAGTVIIHKSLCPPGLAATNPSGAMFPAYLCLPEPGVEFTASREGVGLGSGTTDDAGQATITGLAPGPLRLSELPREGYDPSRVFCVSWPAADGPSGNYAEIPVDNWGVPYELQDGYVIDCIWYNLPAATPSTDPATIILHKYTCPEGYADENKTFEMLLDDCPGRTEGVNFRVEASGSVQDAATTAGGDVQFTGVTPGNLVVDEIPNQGYRPIRAYCDYYAAATGAGTDFLIMGLYPGLSAYLTGGYTLECYWFNLPYIEPAELSILKYLCPPDFGIDGAAQEDVLFNCATPVAGVPFNVTTDAGPHQSPQLTDSAGNARFDDIPAQNLTISELSHGYDTLRVYCGQVSTVSDEAPAGYLELEITGDSVQYSAEPGARITCYWINRVSEFAAVHVYKYNCPPDHDPATADRQYYDGNCQDQPSDVEFMLTPGSGEPLRGATNDEGQLRWNGIPAGQLELVESPPPGYQVVAVYCDARPPEGEADPEPGFTETPYDGLLAYDLLPGHELVCEFFNAPTAGLPPSGSPTPSGSGTPQPTPVDQSGGTGPSGGTDGQTGGSGGQAGGQSGDQAQSGNGPATLIITKHTCPPGYDLFVAGADVVTDCAELTDNIPFALTGANDEAVEAEGITGDDEPGVVTFSELEAGSYVLTESLPEGTASAFVWSCASDQREFAEENPFVPFAYAGPDGQLGLVLVAGETLACDWYDVPEAVVSVLTFECASLVIDVDACDPSTIVSTVTFASNEQGGEMYMLTADQFGEASAVMESGEYAIEVEPGPACLIDSDAFTADGQLLVEKGTPIEVRIYTCGT